MDSSDAASVAIDAISGGITSVNGTGHVFRQKNTSGSASCQDLMLAVLEVIIQIPEGWGKEEQTPVWDAFTAELVNALDPLPEGAKRLSRTVFDEQLLGVLRRVRWRRQDKSEEAGSAASTRAIRNCPQCRTERLQSCLEEIRADSSLQRCSKC